MRRPGCRRRAVTLVLSFAAAGVLCGATPGFDGPAPAGSAGGAALSPLPAAIETAVVPGKPEVSIEGAVPARGSKVAGGRAAALLPTAPAGSRWSRGGSMLMVPGPFTAGASPRAAGARAPPRLRPPAR